ncbi:MAG: hypothetical protein AB7F88_04265 [Pyrinomonadaceae bacterium]
MKRLSENEIIRELKKLDISPLEINIEKFDKKGRSGYSPNLLVEVVWENESWRFLSEIMTVATPKLVVEAVSKLKMFRETSGKESYPMIVAPYLSRPQFKELATREISGIDLSGNVMLIVPGGLFVERVGNPNRFPSSSPIKNVYRGTSSIVGRVLLSRAEYSSVGEVFDEAKRRGAGITLATVSKVLKELDNDFVISRREGIKLVDSETLLSKLRTNYRGTNVTDKLVGKAASLEKALRKIANNCERNEQRYAIHDPQRYVVSPTVGEPLQIYVESMVVALNGIDFEETDRFPNVALIETNDEPVYFDRSWDSKSKQYFTSPLQVYLELSHRGKREQDAAAQLVKGFLRVEADRRPSES